MKSNTLHVKVPGVPPGHRAAKVLQVLDEDFPGRWTYVGDRTLREFPPAALEVACGACDVLVLDVEEALEGARALVAAVGSRIQVVVVASGEEDAGALECMTPRWEAPEENWRLIHLTLEAQETLMDATILFQGSPLRLRDLESTWPGLRNGVGGTLLSALAGGGGVAALGAAPPALRDSDLARYVPRTLDHPSMLDPSVLRDLDACSDHLVLSGFPRAVLENLHITGDILESLEKATPVVKKLAPEFVNALSRIVEQLKDNLAPNVIKRISLQRKKKARDLGGRLSTLGLSNSTPRWTELSHANENTSDKDDAAFRDICEKHKGRNVHWLQCHGHGEETSARNLVVTWRRTEGSGASVARHVRPMSGACRVVHPAPTCAHAAGEGATVWRRKAGLLVGEPGIGKTLFFKRLASEARERAPGRWAVLVQALAHRELLQKWPKSEELAMEHVMELLASAAGVAAPASREDEGAWRFLEAALFHSGAVDVYIDGVDEVCPAFKDKLIRLLELLLETRVQRVWVSSRPQVGLHLSQTLRCPPASLRPFSKMEQKTFLRKHWSSKYNSDLSQFENLADEMVEALHSTAERGQERNILDVPLHTQMAAEVFETLAATALRTGCSLLPKSRITLYELYRRFVDKKRDLYKERYGFNDPNFLNSPFADNFDEIHQNCAMLVLISDGAYDNLDSQTFKDYLEKNKEYLSKEKTGILWLGGDGSPRFAHHTFVEFFAACWMFSQANSSSDIGRTLWEILVSERIGTGVREILEQMLVEGHPLHEAVLEGDCETLEAALATRDPNEVDSFGRLALHLAASLGCSDAVGALLAKGCDLQCRDSLLGWTPLRYASAACKLAAAEKLLQAGANCSDMSVEDVNSSIFAAARLGFVYVMQWHIDAPNLKDTNPQLRKNWAAISVRDECGNTPLHVSANAGQHHIVELLLNNGADANARNKYKITPLMCAADSGNEESVLLLLQHGADVSACDDDEETALHIAARRGHDHIIKLLRENGATINVRNKKRMTPLMYADVYNRGPSVLLLLDYGAEPLFCAENQGMSLHIAASHGHNEIIKRLLDYGADVNLRNEDNATPLMWGTECESEETVRMLLRYGADISACDDEDDTALHWAILFGHPNVVKLLLESGADVNACNNMGITPLMCAVERGNEAVVQLLLQYKADVCTRDMDGDTPLHWATMHNRYGIAKLLLEKGADPKARNRRNATPLVAAVNNQETVELLLRYGAKATPPDENSSLHKSKGYDNLGFERDAIDDHLQNEIDNIQQAGSTSANNGDETALFPRVIVLDKNNYTDNSIHCCCCVVS